MSATTAAPTKARTTEGCRYCWMCRQSCPVGYVTARETYTPHAWALLIESVARGQMKWTPESVDVLYACADCGLCQAHCVTDQPLPAAINNTRVELAATGVAPAAVYELDRRLKAHGNAYAPHAPARSAATGDVALFVGDASLHLAPSAAEAAKKLLAAAGVAHVVIGVGRSTGLAASTVGLKATAAELAGAVVADVQASKAKQVLVLGPGDKWTFDRVYGERLGVAWPAGVVVREVTEVIAEAHAGGRLRLKPTDIGAYSYHDPCHSPRLGKTRPAPRALLTAAFGSAGSRDVFWREHRAHPCGATGGLELTHPEIAQQLAEARLGDAAAAGAACLVTEDPTCLHHLAGRGSAKVAVKSLYEVLAAQL